MNDTGNTAQTADLRLDRPLVFFDIESTGTSPRNDRIIELAAIRLSPDGTEESRTWRVNPGMPIPPEITRLTGIRDSDVKGAPDEAAAMRMFLDFAGNAPLIAHNALFDTGFMSDACLRHGIPFDPVFLDSLVLSHISLVSRRNAFLSKAASEYALLLKQLVDVGTWRMGGGPL